VSDDEVTDEDLGTGDPTDGDPTEPAPPEPDEDPGVDPGEDEGNAGDAGEPDASSDPDDGTPEDTPEDDGTDDPAPDEAGDTAPPLAGDPSTSTSSDDGAFGPDLRVTDVRVAGHDGFDRLVLEVEGDGRAGWWVAYADEAIEQGRGGPIELAGDAVLEVAATNVALPPELPDGEGPWSEETVAGPDDGVIVEVVDDSIYEGRHRMVVGTTGEQPFLVDRLEDPQRIVIDVFHDDG
jgi:hypothetical protein